MRIRQRVLILIWVMMAVAYLDRVNISVAGPTMMAALHLSHSAFGLVLAAFTLGYALMQIPGGWSADRFGAKPLLVTALTAWSAFTALTAAAWSLTSLLVIRVLFGVGEGMENGAQFKLIGDYFPSRERSSANAYFLSALALGPALAAPVAAWLLIQVGWRGLFLCFTIPGLIVALMLAFFLPKPPAEVAQPVVSKENPPAPAWQEMLHRTSSWLAFAAYLFFNIAFWGFLGWMPTYLSSTRHIQLASLGIMASIPYFCGFVGLLILGWLGSRPLYRSRAILVGISDILAAGFLYLTFDARTLALSLVGLSLAAFFLYGGFGPFWAIVIDLAPEEMRGAFTGYVNLGGQIGGFFAPIVVGIIFDATHSFTGGFLVMIMALIVAAVSLFALHNAQPR